jgi:hypothetical protein
LVDVVVVRVRILVSARSVLTETAVVFDLVGGSSGDLHPVGGVTFDAMLALDAVAGSRSGVELVSDVAQTEQLGCFDVILVGWMGLLTVTITVVAHCCCCC